LGSYFRSELTYPPNLKVLKAIDGSKKSNSMNEEGTMGDIYEKVRQRLDMFPQGFPKTTSGVELEILRRLFSPEEGEIMLALRPSAEPASMVAARVSRDAEEIEK
jgi:hypothetical protein